MDRFKAAATATLQWLWAATQTTARYTWATILWIATATWAVTRWAGRVTLWIVCWPLALYRGHNKKTERRHQELVAAVKKN
jgi:hypothetical protein